LDAICDIFLIMAVVDVNTKFGSHDWDTMSVQEWSAHTDVPGMYLDERKNLYEDILPAAMKDVEIVIDIGCGLGEDTFHIAQAYPNAEVVGIDFNKDFLRHDEKILASDYPSLQHRVSFQWADLRLMSEADKLRDLTRGRRALYYMGGNTIGIVPEGLEATIGAAMDIQDKFLVVAHYTPFLKTMYLNYYAKVVGEADLSLTNFDKGLYVSKGDYRSQWFTPETLSARITKFANLFEDSCVCGAAAGVFGLYSKQLRSRM
jgi:SAM-dependent methyltransferase